MVSYTQNLSGPRAGPGVAPGDGEAAGGIRESFMKTAVPDPFVDRSLFFFPTSLPTVGNHTSVCISVEHLSPPFS